MPGNIQWVENGGVTDARGFRAGAAFAGIKTYGPEPRYDVGMLVSDVPASVAGVFTTSRVCGAPVELCRQRLQGGRGRGRGVVVNSGVSNVAMGDRGRENAREMAALAADLVQAPKEEFFVASTGVIGRPLPMDKISAGIQSVQLAADGGELFSRAIMTTDTVPKSRAVRISAGEAGYTIGGAAKGAGMAHPDMATVLCFLTTDAPVEPRWLQSALERAAGLSLNMMDIDMDTSTSDTMLVFANGAAGGDPIDASHALASAFQEALDTLSIELARDLARDGEGARTLIEARVKGARDLADARKAARTIVSSPLVKTMVTGCDPNLGRVMMAIGRSGADVEVGRVSVYIGEHCAFANGVATDLDLRVVSQAMKADEVTITVDLGLGSASATAWGCDLTADYVRINAEYTT